MKKLLVRLMAITVALFLPLLALNAQSVESLKGKSAPVWSLKGPDGSTVRLADLKGKIVIIDFWATWCGPCKAAMPSIQKISKAYANKGVVVVGINAWEENPQSAIDYMKQQKFDYQLLLKGDDVAASYHVEGIPTIVIIDKKGIVADVHVGFDPNLEKILSGVIEKLLARP